MLLRVCGIWGPGILACLLWLGCQGNKGKMPLLRNAWKVVLMQVRRPKRERKVRKINSRQSCPAALAPPWVSLPAGLLRDPQTPRRDLFLEPQADPSFLDSVDVGKSPDIPYVYVGHQGEVQNYKPLQVVTACSLDIYNFPFDVQNCSLTFTSWLHTSE